MRKRLKRNRSSPRSSGKANVMACALFPERDKVKVGQEPILETCWGVPGHKRATAELPGRNLVESIME